MAKLLKVCEVLVIGLPVLVFLLVCTFVGLRVFMDIERLLQ